MISTSMLSQPPRFTTSPTGSPALRPAEGVMARSDGGEQRDRSRATSRRSGPWVSPRIARSRSRPRGDIDEAIVEFAKAIVEIARARKGRAAELGVSPTAACPSSPGRGGEPLVELIVDVPVWSVGCFADLSTLHALRDNTLARVHTLIFHLNEAHALQATYKLQAKRPCCIGWGSITVAASPFDQPGVHRAVRRASFVLPEREGSGGVASPPRRSSDNSIHHLPSSYRNESAITDSESEHSVDLREVGHQQCHDEDEQEGVAQVQAEITRRNLREGSAFVFKVKDGLNMIVV